MFESWEWRGGDLDLEYLRSRNIRVVATNERHPDVDVFGYLGEMAVQLTHQAGQALHNNRLVVVTNNPFGPYLARTLSSWPPASGWSTSPSTGVRTPDSTSSGSATSRPR